MPRYRYRGRTLAGELITGTDTAESAEEVLRRLESDGIIPIEIKESMLLRMTDASGGGIDRFFRPVNKRDVALFASQLATLLGAGVSLTRSLQAIQAQVKNPLFKQVIGEINDAVEGGATLGEAFASHPLFFEESAISMVMAGEASGNLEAALRQVAALIEYQLDIKTKITQATRYPKIVIFVLCVASAILMIFVVPQFQFLFSLSRRIELPLPTRILIGTSNVFRMGWMYLLVVGLVLWSTWKSLLTNSKVRLWWDRTKLQFPLFGQIRVKFAFSQFSRSLSNMLRAGMSVTMSFELAAGVVGNSFLAQAIRQMLDDLVRGKTLTSAAQDTGVFPPMVEQMIAVGEESGQLDTMLDKVAQYYDNEIELAIKRLSAAIEPMLTAVVASIVLLFALAVFLPMWEMLTVLKSQSQGN